jgi:hypothetical protein
MRLAVLASDNAAAAPAQSGRAAAVLRSWLRAPVDDGLRAVDAAVAAGRTQALLIVFAGAAIGWWLYVPVHELLHAFGCWATGGTVTRLEIDGMYGAAALRVIFPFVTVGSAYAGRLSGFDTHGSDLVYLVTDLAPFALTVVAGVPALRALARGPSSRLRAVLTGAALPLAYAPFLSIGGDCYEMGSIVVSRVARWIHPAFDLERWRSDDVVKLVTTLLHAPGGPSAGDVAGVIFSSVLGLAVAFGLYGAGCLWARWLERRKSAA